MSPWSESMVHGCMAHGPWHMVHGPWFMVHCPWSMVHDPLSMVHGALPMVYGPLSIICKAIKLRGYHKVNVSLYRPNKHSLLIN